MKFISHDVNFQSGKNGPQLKIEKIDLRRHSVSSISKIAVVLTGFKLDYSSSDHHVHRMCVSADINEPGPPFGNELELEVKIGLRDLSGNWDDSYSGQVNVGLIVIEESDVELNTGTVKFRSNTGGVSTQNDNIQVLRSGESQAVFLSGFDIFFDGADHHIGEVLARVELNQFSMLHYQFSNVQGTLGLRDYSGNWDDPFRGYLSYTTLTYPNAEFAVAKNRITKNSRSNRAVGTTRIPLNSTDVSLENIAIGLNEFILRFSNGDHHLDGIESRVTRQLKPDGRQVLVEVTHEGGIYDKDGYNDPFSSTAGFTLLVPNNR